MKKINYLLTMLLLATVVMFTGCDEEGEELADGNNSGQATDTGAENPGGILMSFSVHVVEGLGGGTGFSETRSTALNGLDGASVTVSSVNKTQTIEVDESGIATIDGLFEGLVSVYVTLDSLHQSFDGAYYLDYNGSLDPDNLDALPDTVKMIRGNSRLMVALPRINTETSVSGVVYGDFDIDGVVDPSADADKIEGLTVKLKYGQSYTPNEYVTTTDANGTYTFSGVPEGNGYNSPEIVVLNHQMADTVVNQVRVFSQTADVEDFDIEIGQTNYLNEAVNMGQGTAF